MKYLLLLLGFFPMFADDLTEIRGASNRYRFLGWTRTFSHKPMMDIYYIGTPGANELNIGGGYKCGRSISVTPLAYASVRKEGKDVGLKLAILAVADTPRWKAGAYLARYVRVHGQTSSYLVLDTADFTRVINKHWEVGGSTGFFHQSDKWDLLVGPLVRRNDEFGGWSVSLRFGSETELRLTRTFAWGK